VVEKMGHRICFRSGLTLDGDCLPHISGCRIGEGGAVIRGRAAMRESMAAQHGIMEERLSPPADSLREAQEASSISQSQNKLKILTVPSRTIDL
jgi:hypothetical protein